MTPSLEETIYLDFITSDATGAAADADSTPTAEVFENATDTTVVALTVTKRTSKTGNYRVPVACTAANGFEAGKSYNVIASATIGGVAAKCKIGSFQVRRDSVRTGTAQAGASSTITLDSGASAVDNFYKRQRVFLTGGTGAGQDRVITGYVGSTKVATVGINWTTNPDGTTTFSILPDGSVNVIQWDSVYAGSAVVGANVLAISGVTNNADALAVMTSAYNGGTFDVQSVTNAITLPAIPTDWISATGVKADAVTKIQSGLATPTNITAATGVVLAATGLDQISATSPTALATTFREKVLQVWERFFGKVVKDDNAGTVKVMQGTGSTAQTTQTFTSATGVDTINKAT